MRDEPGSASLLGSRTTGKCSTMEMMRNKRKISRVFGDVFSAKYALTTCLGHKEYAFGLPMVGHSKEKMNGVLFTGTFT